MSSGVYIVYIQRDPIPHEGYIGKSDDIDKRFEQHKTDALGSNPDRAHKWMQDVGVENLACRVLIDNLLTEAKREDIECSMYLSYLSEGWTLYNDRDPCKENIKIKALRRLASPLEPSAVDRMLDDLAKNKK